MKQAYILKFWEMMRTRVITFYLLVIAVCLVFVDYQAVISHARGATLSRLMPSFEYMNDLASRDVKIDRDQLKEYAFYYGKVAEYIPRADVWGILGYIHFHLGQDKKAINYFRKAAITEPQVFNFHYNMGVIYFNRGFYGEAIESLRQALDTSIDENMQYITSSKVYYPYLGSMEDLSIRLKEYLKDGSHNAFRLLISSSLFLKDYKGMLSYATLGISAALDQEKDLYYFAGVAAFKLGKFSPAIKFFKEYITAHPTDSNALYYMGLALSALGEKPAGEKLLQRAQEVHESGGSIEDIQADMITLHIF